METWFYYKMEFMCLCKMSANHKVLCKSLQPPLFSLCFEMCQLEWKRGLKGKKTAKVLQNSLNSLRQAFL